MADTSRSDGSTTASSPPRPTRRAPITVDLVRRSRIRVAVSGTRHSTTPLGLAGADLSARTPHCPCLPCPRSALDQCSFTRPAPRADGDAGPGRILPVTPPPGQQPRALTSTPAPSSLYSTVLSRGFGARRRPPRPTVRPCGACPPGLQGLPSRTPPADSSGKSFWKETPGAEPHPPFPRPPRNTDRHRTAPAPRPHQRTSSACSDHRQQGDATPRSAAHQGPRGPSSGPECTSRDTR